MAYYPAFTDGKNLVRRGVHALAAVAALSLAAPDAAVAQNQNDVVHTPACMKLRPRLAQLRCEIVVAKQKTVEANRRAAEADRRSAEAIRQGAEADRQGAEADRRRDEADRRGAEADRRGAEADRRGAEADRRGAEADRRGAEADRQAAADIRERKCTLFIKAGLTSNDPIRRIDKQEVKRLLNGKSFRDVDACTISAHFGYAPS